jgi:hypothetical protein
MNDRLRADLTSGADTFDLPPGDLGAVVQRARHRNRRRQRASATVGALALVAAGATTYRVANPDEKTDVASHGTATGAGRLGDSGIEWRAGDGASALVGNVDLTAAQVGGTTYALSTAPGEADPDHVAAKALWRSADGTSWEQATMPGFSPSRLASADDRLYAIGTGPATSGTSVHLGWSEGGDGAWQDLELPLDLSDLRAISSSVQVVPIDVAATDDAAVAVVQVGADLDLAKALPGVAAPHGWYLADDGIDILGDGPGCPAGTSEDDPAADAKRRAVARSSDAVKPAKAERPDPAGQRQYQVACFSADGTGTTYEPSELYGIAEHHGFADLGLTGDSLLAAQGDAIVFRADPSGGSSIHRVDIGETGRVAAVEAVDGGFVLVRTDGAMVKGPNRSPSELLRSSDGEDWVVDRAFPASDWMVTLGTVDGHLAFVSSDADGGVYGELADGTWRTTSLTELIDAPKGSWVGTAAIGPLGVVAVVGAAKGDVPTTSILASRDGRTWSRTALADVVGSEGYLDRIVIRDDRAVLSGATIVHGKSRRVAIVGTPR